MNIIPDTDSIEVAMIAAAVYITIAVIGDSDFAKTQQDRWLKVFGEVYGSLETTISASNALTSS